MRKYMAALITTLALATPATAAVRPDPAPTLRRHHCHLRPDPFHHPRFCRRHKS